MPTSVIEVGAEFGDSHASMSDIEIANRDGPVERVPVETVVRAWARQEYGDESDVDVESRSAEELVERFDDPERLAKSIFFDEDLSWYRVELTEEELRNLLVVKGPEDEGWRAVAEGNSIEHVAEHIAETDEVEALDETVSKDVDDITDMADEYRSGEEAGAFVVVQESLDEHAYLADGNHRAVAIVHHVLTGGEYEKQTAYVGIPHEADGANIDEERDVTGDHPAH